MEHLYLYCNELGVLPEQVELMYIIVHVVLVLTQMVAIALAKVCVTVSEIEKVSRVS